MNTQSVRAPTKQIKHLINTARKTLQTQQPLAYIASSTTASGNLPAKQNALHFVILAQAGITLEYRKALAV